MSTEATAGVLPEQTLVGSVVAGKYRVDRLLGHGGMGAVFQATNLAIGKRVALKFLTRDAARDAEAAQRFQREALAASMVESSHIVQIFDSGTSDDGLPFLVMELLTGEDVRARLQREQRLSVEVAAAIGVQVLRALVRAHAQGIVHRDLKPDNIYLCERDDGALLVKLVDFGVSKLARGPALDTLTGRGTVLGTAYYMSPEQAQALEDVDGRTDLFSVGAILYECLSGRPPHVGPTYEAVLIAICTKDPEDIRSLAPVVPRALADVIHRALARERSQRYASAEAMLDELCAALPGALSPRTEASSVPLSSANMLASRGALGSSGRGARRRRARSVALGALALISGFALTALWLGRRGSLAAAKDDAAVELRHRAPAAVLPQPSAVAAPRADTSAVTSAGAAPSASISAAPSASASAVPAVSAPATKRAVESRKRSSKSAAKAPSTDARPAKGGVVSGLELSTREP